MISDFMKTFGEAPAPYGYVRSPFLRFMTAVYRANPVRPHCDANAGRHTWLCRAVMPRISSTDPGDLARPGI